MKNTLSIQNLKCGGCANTIITQLSKLDGISEVTIDNETSEVSFNSISENEIEIVKDKLAHLGYPIVGDSNSIPTKAKSFVSCAVGRMTK